MNNKSFIYFLFIFNLFLFAYSGLIKWVTIFFDPTLVFGLISLLAIPVLLRRNSVFLLNPLYNSIFYILIIHFFVFISIAYTVSDNYYIIKTVKINFNLLALFLPIIILRSNEHFEFFKKLLWFALILCVSLLLFELVDNNLDRIRYNNPDDATLIPDYMSISYFLGSMIILFSDTKKKFDLLVLMLSFIFMLLLAAKGPIIFLVFSLLIKHRNQYNILSFKTLASLVISFIIAQLFTLITSRSIFFNISGRLLFFSEGLEADQSSLERVLLFTKTIELIKKNFILGVGIGGFSKELYGVDGRLSAHNIFLEIWSELGVFPIIILIILIYKSFYNYRRILVFYEESLAKSITFVILYNLFALLVSSYFEDIRLTYFWIGVSIAYFSIMLKNKITCVE